MRCTRKEARQLTIRSTAVLGRASALVWAVPVWAALALAVLVRASALVSELA
jgi:hypothetical protein